MIPKIIHYCWFGYGEKSKLIKKCIKSWSKICPDYEIKEWNEENFDISMAPKYVQDAYKEKRWAFVADYARLWIIYNYGGVYLDTDVELIRNIDDVLKDDAFFAFANSTKINTGLGFGAIKGFEFVKTLMDDYDKIDFYLEDGTVNTLTCVAINTPCFLNYGFKLNNTLQKINGCTLYPTDYFCPKAYNTYKPEITENTFSIHWYNLSWKTKENKDKHIKGIRKDYIKHLPNKALIKVLGNENYEKLKGKLK